jgi:hypothetical protein
MAKNTARKNHTQTARTSPALPHIDSRESAAFDAMFQISDGMSLVWHNRIWTMYQQLRAVKDPRSRMDSMSGLLTIAVRVTLGKEGK